MKKLILAGTLALVATAAQAQCSGSTGSDGAFAVAASEEGLAGRQ